MKSVKIISVIILVILVVNIILIALGKIPIILFWVIIGLAAVFAYFILPKLQAKEP